MRGQVQLGVLLIVCHHRGQRQKLLDQRADARIALQQGLGNAMVGIRLDQPQQAGHEDEVSDSGVCGPGHPAARGLLQQLLDVAEVLGQDLVVQRLAHRGDVILGEEAEAEAT